MAQYQLKLAICGSFRAKNSLPLAVSELFSKTPLQKYLLN